MDCINLPVPIDQLTRTQFLSLIDGINRYEREDAVKAIILAGNVPQSLRRFVDIDVSGNDKNGKHHQLILRVLHDYLSIGTDDDKILTPLFPTTAQEICDALDCMLPTTKIVDMVWKMGQNKLEPKPWGPPYDSTMMSTERIDAHNSRILAQIKSAGFTDLTALTVGHKKDVVVTKHLKSTPKQVAIYGWHRKNGKPIQPLYLGHEFQYADYSHAIRLIGLNCTLDGLEHRLNDLLSDPILATLISSEGPHAIWRQPSV